MSNKKTKPGNNRPDGQPNRAGAQHHKCNLPDVIHVRGEIETKIPPSAREKHDAAEKKKESRDNFRFIVEILTLIFVILYASLTYWQARTSASQLLENQKQTIATTENFKMGQRAWITVNESRFIRILKPGEKSRPEEHLPSNTIGTLLVPNTQIFLRFGFKNGGVSPARNVVFRPDEPMFVGEDCAKMFPLPSPYDSKGILGPGEAVVISNFSFAMPEACVNALSIGRATFTIKGTIKYDDIFGESHHTRYCLQYEGLASGHMTACPDGNELD